jgi:hypothetical protein
MTHTPASGPAELVTVPLMESFFSCVAWVVPREKTRQAKMAMEAIPRGKIRVNLI